MFLTGGRETSENEVSYLEGTDNLVDLRTQNIQSFQTLALSDHLQHAPDETVAMCVQKTHLGSKVRIFSPYEPRYLSHV